MRTLLARLGLGSRPLVGWAMYDWANSAFYTLIIASVYPVFFERYAAAGAEKGLATQRHAIATFAALAVVAVISPVLGAAVDMRGGKKKLLAAFLALGVGATLGLAFVGRGEWVLGSALFVVANVGIVGSIVFYDALLPHLVRGSELDKVSTAGYALGYLGGGIALLLALPVIAAPQRFGIADSYLAMRWSFVGVAVWWALFSIPIFRWVPEPPVGATTAAERSQPLFKVAVGRLAGTFRDIRRYRQAFLLLLAVMIYSDGIGTIIRMAAIYGAELGLSEGVLIGTVLMLQFVGMPFAFLFGALGARIGTKPAIFVGLVVYAGLSVYGFFIDSALEFVILGFMVATVQGGTQALSRSLFASFVPAAKSSEFFGFFAIFEKFAGTLGPALFAAIAAATGSSRHAILGVAAFFIVGGALLLRVDVDAGRREAAQADEDLRRAAEGEALPLTAAEVPLA
jgi:UMF1 family MFS transporter